MTNVLNEGAVNQAPSWAAGASPATPTTPGTVTAIPASVAAVVPRATILNSMRKWYYGSVDNGTTKTRASNMVGNGDPGTVGAAGVKGDQADGASEKVTSAAAANALFGWETNWAQDVVQLQWRPYMASKFRTGSSIADMRFYASAFVTNGTVIADTNTPPNNGIGLRYASNISPNWYLCVWSAGVMTAEDTGIPVTADTTYVTEVWYDGTTLRCTINGVAFAHTAAGFPAANTKMTGFYPAEGSAISGASAKHCYVYGFTIEVD